MLMLIYVSELCPCAVNDFFLNKLMKSEYQEFKVFKFIFVHIKNKINYVDIFKYH